MMPIVFCGPTASGKTAAAIALAEKIGGEIINADSGQVYRGLDIGTAKPTIKEQKHVPFYLLDIREPSETFSAAEFRRLALVAMEEIQTKGKVPILCGGTGLYLRALEFGLFEGPSADPKMRQRLEEEIKKEGIDAFHERLKRIDPVAAAAITPGNRQRLVRAREVFELTGKPISEFWKEHQSQRPERDYLKVGLDWPKEILNARIKKRVTDMMAQGWVEEVRGLQKYWETPALKIIGYQEIVSHLKGEITLEEARDLIQQHTRQYAKRQRTWFRKDPKIHWFDAEEKLIQFCLTNS